MPRTFTDRTRPKEVMSADDVALSKLLATTRRGR